MRVFTQRKAALVLMFLALSSSPGCNKSRVPPPAMLWAIPSWSLTDQEGHSYGTQQLQGTVYVANFIFTRCPTSCPRLTTKMAALEARLRLRGDRVRFVSMSVDPEWDTPERLRVYGARYHADFRRWHFVTGPYDSVLRAIDSGFRVSSGMSPIPPGATFDPISLAHSNHFVVIDGRGFMRGAFSVEDDSGVERVAQVVETLTEP